MRPCSDGFSELGEPVWREQADLPLKLYRLKTGDATAPGGYERIQRPFTQSTSQAMETTARHTRVVTRNGS
ncbi:hypothetical protein Raf01_89480 [Rugosimonospora africana]|uniref:Uncharacterized protein n=1 Tax=Rugosimonospora africana TaxID=556532 RepID=A0A8J3R202_9ACTN|nr:hypothetical protein Raf01_89480 [Rugosimonospora africana]